MSKRKALPSVAPKAGRRILAPELVQLKALVHSTNAAYEALQDATLAHATAKAAYEAVATKYQRYGGFLVKRYRLKADEEIDNETGVLRKAPPKPNA